MSINFRQFAVSGSAAVAVLGGAAAITTATAPTAHAVETQTVAHHAVTAPVTLPDGRTMRITGMGGYGHHATAGHVATVASFQADTVPGGTDGIGSGLTPDNGGAGSQLQNPYNQQPQYPAGYNQQITTQASGGAIGAGVAAILVLGIIVFFKVKHGHIKAFDAILVSLLGIAMAGTVVGSMGHQVTNSIISSLSGVLGGL
ncbi:hypothetical protein ACFVAF_25375 [Streptomyces sp. NPDC057596]|uniref:hypothetical protein n=1 Tax=Streptomyces sp. NPDC057596 TaxID=3346178 RepID=UPI0036870BC6